MPTQQEIFELDPAEMVARLAALSQAATEATSYIVRAELGSTRTRIEEREADLARRHVARIDRELRMLRDALRNFYGVRLR